MMISFVFSRHASFWYERGTALLDSLDRLPNKLDLGE